jgi:ribose 5-phosphate isomerase A
MIREAPMELDQIKRTVASYAAERYVKNGMKVGLGTGSTAIFVVRRLAERLAAGELSEVRVVATSTQTEMECENFGIPLFEMNSRAIDGEIDVAIDGADEVDPANNLIKGGGAAHLREKIVEYAAKRFIVVVDESKLVEHLALKFPLPVEIVPEARVLASRAIQRLGGSVTVRVGSGKDGPVVTDHGNIILDSLFATPIDPARYETTIKLIPGVVAVGFFTRNRPTVIIGHADGSVTVRD